MKKIIGLALVLTMVMSMIACSNGSKTEDEKKDTQTEDTKKEDTKKEDTKKEDTSNEGTEAKTLNIYGIYKSEGTYFVNEAEAAEAEMMALGEKYGFEGTWHFLTSENDPEKCMTQVETAIADNADAVIVCVPDQTMSQSVVDACEAAGVIVVAVDDALIDSTGSILAPWFGIDAYNIGYSAGEWMAGYATDNNLLDDPKTGILYMTMDTVTSCVPRIEGEKAAWADAHGEALSDRTFFADYLGTQEEAYNNGLAVITGNPDISNWLVMVANEPGAMGAAAALETSGLDKTSCVISLGCDEIANLWEAGSYEVIRSAAYFSGKVVGKESMNAIVEFVINGTEIPAEYATPAVICDPETAADIML